MLVGFGVGLSLIVAIGAQNAFVLRQGIARQHVLAVVAVCSLSDAILIIAGVAGIGAVVQAFPTAITVVTIGGALFLTAYAVTAFRRAWRPAALTVDDAGSTVTLRTAVLTVLALTWLNPHVYLDTVVFLGSVANRETGSARWWFAAGAVLASLVWFAVLGFGARLATPVFAKPAAWRVLDIGIGVVMLLIAVVLVDGLTV